MHACMSGHPFLVRGNLPWSKVGARTRRLTPHLSPPPAGRHEVHQMEWSSPHPGRLQQAAVTSAVEGLLQVKRMLLDEIARPRTGRPAEAVRSRVAAVQLSLLTAMICA